MAWTAAIYLIRNLKNHKVYIGSGINIEKRRTEHFNALRKGVHHNKHLQRAWNKYGEDIFEFKILLYCNSEELLGNEQDAMDYYTELLGWAGLCNISPTAGSSLGVKRSMETRAKLSVSHKGKKFSPETRARMSAAGKGNTNSRGAKRSLETRAKLSASARMKQSPETCAKISASLTGRKKAPPSPETRAKLSAASMGHKVSKETRAKISASHKKRRSMH